MLPKYLSSLRVAMIAIALGTSVFTQLIYCQIPAGTTYVDSAPAYYYPPASPPNGSGFFQPYSVHINGAGQAVSTFGYHFENGQYSGTRAVEWDFGLGHRLLDTVGNADPNGWYSTYSTGINSAGQISGQEFVYDNSTGQYVGYQPVIWDSATGSATQLGHLSSHVRNTLTYGINDSGAVCGYSTLTNSSGVDIGFRPVRWEAGSTTPTELELPGGTNLSGWTTGVAQAINSSGAVIGWGYNWDSAGNALPASAIRWDSGTTTATVLADPTGQTGQHLDTVGLGITDSGYAWGQYVELFNGGTQSSTRAVRWDVAGNGTLLQSLGAPADDSSIWYNDVFAINNDGTAVGISNYWDAAGNDLGQRAVKWNSNSDTPTELANLGTDPMGRAFGYASDINDAGLIVGSQSAYNSNTGFSESHAVVWLPNGTLVDLTTLPFAPARGGSATWQLLSVNQVAADGWAAGFGIVDEDGAGSQYLPMYMTWSAQLGLGGVWVGPGSGSRWGDGRNWSTGTPALSIGRAIFNHPGLMQVLMDRDASTMRVDIEQGQLSLDIGGWHLQSDEGFWIHAGARLAARTIIDFRNEIIGSLEGDVFNEGTLAPGNSPGTLNIYGDLYNTGNLEFEIAGLAEGQFDRLLLLDGTFHAGGSLKLLLAGYAPELGDEFDLMDWAILNQQGMLFDFSAAQLSTGLVWDSSDFWEFGVLRVTAVPEPAGFGFLAGCCVFSGIYSRRARNKSRNLSIAV